MQQTNWRFEGNEVFVDIEAIEAETSASFGPNAGGPSSGKSTELGAGMGTVAGTEAGKV